MEFDYDDGGRSAAGFRGDTGDCGVRALAIAAGVPYKQVYDRIAELGKRERTGKRKSSRSHPRTGTYRKTFDRVAQELGFVWNATMGIGTGCRVHLRADELPSGRIIVALSKHYAAVINGVLHDTYDCSRDGTRCVYGYWRQS